MDEDDGLYTGGEEEQEEQEEQAKREKKTKKCTKKVVDSGEVKAQTEPMPSPSSAVYSLPIYADRENGEIAEGAIVVFPDHLEVNGVFEPDRSFLWSEIIPVAYYTTNFEERKNPANGMMQTADLLGRLAHITSGDFLHREYMGHQPNSAPNTIFITEYLEKISITVKAGVGKQSLILRRHLKGANTSQEILHNRAKKIDEFNNYLRFYTG